MDWHEWFLYDETSPTCLRWKVARYTGKKYVRLLMSAGDVAGARSGTKGYFVVSLDSRNYRVNRVIWEMHNGCIPDGMQVDHFNTVRTDNRIENLRLTTNAVNCRNKRRSKRNTTGITGVCKVTRNRYGKEDAVYAATWMEVNGRTRRIKTFSVCKYGEEEAKRLAIEHREKMIEELNKQGAGYTKRHGEVA